MSNQVYPSPSPDPFDYPGNATGVLLIHGFTGSPAEVRPLGQYLAGQGYTAVGPLLPGHGTTWQDLNRRRWPEWTEAVEHHYRALAGRCRTVFVVGGSLGGLLSLYLAARHPELAAVVVMAPALAVADWRARWLWLLKHLVRFAPYDPARQGDDLTDPLARRRYMWSYMGTPTAAADQVVRLQGQVKRGLARIAMPILVLHGTHDRAVPLDSSRYVYGHVASADRELVWLDNSGHCLWVDSEREQVWDKIHRFIAQRA